MIPIKIKIEGFGEKTYRTLLCQLKFKIEKVQGREVLTMRIMSLERILTFLFIYLLYLTLVYKIVKNNSTNKYQQYQVKI